MSDAAAAPDQFASAIEPKTEHERQVTVVALFADTIDAEAALRALERDASSPAGISLLIRTGDEDPADVVARPGAVARSLVATALDSVGAWLLGLTALIVPGRGAYLVAGPLGAALRGDEAISAEHPRPIGLVPALAAFGYVEDEAIYLEHRLEAGDVLLAVTCSDPAEGVTARRLFADYDAIHISLGMTESGLAASATSALTAVLRAATGAAGTIEAPVLLRGLGDRQSPDAAHGVAIVDRFGEDTGTIDELLTDAPADSSDALIRYVVVAFGGLLGIGRQYVAVPAELADLTTRPVHLAVERQVLQHAPRFAGASLSRRDELAIRAYFGVEPYWAGSED